MPRPDSIAISLEITRQDDTKETVSLEADVVFENEDEDNCEDNLPMVAQDSDIYPDELAIMIRKSFFCPSPDPRSDSYDTQENYHMQAYTKTALQTLYPQDQAAEATLADLATRYLADEVHPGTTAVITIPARGAPTVEIRRDETG